MIYSQYCFNVMKKSFSSRNDPANATFRNLINYAAFGFVVMCRGKIKIKINIQQMAFLPNSRCTTNILVYSTQQQTNKSLRKSLLHKMKKRDSDVHVCLLVFSSSSSWCVMCGISYCLFSYSLRETLLQ